MRVIRSFLFVLLVFTFLNSTYSVPKELMWISFAGPGSGKFLMQIDALGNVIMAPTRVSEGSKTHPSHVTALSFNGTNALNFWFISSNNDGSIFRIVINKASLKSVRIIQTSLVGLGGRFSTINVSHRSLNNLISFPKQISESISVVAYPLDESGRVVGSKRFLSPSLLQPACENKDCTGGIVSNGRLSYWVTSDPVVIRRAELFIQPIGPGGHPIGDPVLADKIITQFISRGVSKFTAVDATDTLVANKKYLVYMQQPATPSEPERPKLLLQQIDATTGKQLEKPIVLYREVEEFGGNTKIDPDGRFVLFVTDEPPGLFYQALDVTGRPNGQPKNLYKARISGIDLLRERI